MATAGPHLSGGAHICHVATAHFLALPTLGDDLASRCCTHRLQATAQALQRHAVGNRGGGRAFTLGALEDFRQGRANVFDMRLELRGAATGALVADIDDAAGIDRVVRRAGPPAFAG